MWLTTTLFGWEGEGGENMGSRPGQTSRLGGSPTGKAGRQVMEIVFALFMDIGGLLPVPQKNNLSVKRKTS